MPGQRSQFQQNMPNRRTGHTTAVTIGGEQFHVTANADDDGALGEVFLRWNKHGSTAAGLIDGYATALSIALRHRIPLASLIRHGLNLRFSPSGHTDDPDIPAVASIADYVSRRLALDWLPYPERTELGIFTFAERLQAAPAWRARTHNGGTPNGGTPNDANRAAYIAAQNLAFPGIFVNLKLTKSMRQLRVDA